MSFTHVGEVSIQAAIPGAVAGLIAAMADLNAKLEAMIAFSVQIGLPSISFDAQLELLAQITASVNAAISIGLTPPSVDAQLAIVLDVIAQLKLALQIYIDLFALLANAGLHIYAYDGAVNALGPEATTALASGLPGGGGPGAHCNALVLVTELGATWAAMGGVFLTA